jgi:predicted nucleic acid-binding protein
MTELVLDASMTLAALLQEHNSVAATDLMDRVAVAGAVVPGHWHLEVGNALLLAERKARISSAQRVSFIKALLAMPIQLDPETTTRAWQDTLTLAGQYRLTLYDAAYLELSIRLSIPLATFDAALRRAATAASVTLL